MPQVRIPSIDDDRIRSYRDLKDRQTDVRLGRFIAEGRWLVDRLIASDLQIDSLLVEPRCAEHYTAAVPSSVPVYLLERGMIEQLVGFNFHRGVLACGRRPITAVDAKWLMPDERLPSPLVVGCDIHDSENLGGILRNCAAFGAHTVIMAGHSADPYSRRVLRTSMGTVFQLRLIVEPNLDSVMTRLEQTPQYHRCAAVLAADARPLDQARTEAPIALLFGNEAHGIPQSICDRCDERVTIPMQLGTDSLNVAVAAGIFLYHFTRS